MVFEPNDSRLMLRLAMPTLTPIPNSPYAEISLEQKLDINGPVLEITVRSRELFYEFLQLAGLIVTQLEQNEGTPLKAFFTSVESWRELTLYRKILSPERQLGLLGELYLLTVLSDHYGPKAIEMWTAYASMQGKGMIFASEA